MQLVTNWLDLDPWKVFGFFLFGTTEAFPKVLFFGSLYKAYFWTLFCKKNLFKWSWRSQVLVRFCYTYSLLSFFKSMFWLKFQPEIGWNITLCIINLKLSWLRKRLLKRRLKAMYSRKWTKNCLIFDGLLYAAEPILAPEVEVFHFHCVGFGSFYYPLLNPKAGKNHQQHKFHDLFPWLDNQSVLYHINRKHLIHSSMFTQLSAVLRNFFA